MVTQPQEHVGFVSAKMVAGLLWRTWQQPTITRSVMAAKLSIEQDMVCFSALTTEALKAAFPGNTHTQNVHL